MDGFLLIRKRELRIFQEVSSILPDCCSLFRDEQLRNREDLRILLRRELVRLVVGVVMGAV